MKNEAALASILIHGHLLFCPIMGSTTSSHIRAKYREGEGVGRILMNRRDGGKEIKGSLKFHQSQGAMGVLVNIKMTLIRKD